MEIKQNQKHKKQNEKRFNVWKNLYTSERFESTTVNTKNLRKVVQWRMKDRMKTQTVGLTLCLNIGVDPPDIIKTNPSARLECWIDPFSMPVQKALDSIGKALSVQYERWQPRAHPKVCPDPTVEDVKKLCTSLRRLAKEDRVLFHYNGHGVPRPTNNGELWVFNKSYTQYIPLSIYDLLTWVGNPSIYVFDCSGAGLIIQWFHKFTEQREQEIEKAKKKDALSSSQTAILNQNNPTPTNANIPPVNPLSFSSPPVFVAPPPNPSLRDYILLCACGVNDVLPSSPELPADLFTSCLTTPIQTALKWFCTQTIISGVDPELVDKLPGQPTERRTPFGELNWIFTAITDTIAWNVLPSDLFQKLFRQDLLVSSLFRNFLLAERIMRSCKCFPVSYPRLPPTYNHPMWQAWDLACDHCLAQLPQLLASENKKETSAGGSFSGFGSVEYKHSMFFSEQLTAFEVWLEFGTEDKNPPEQLPIVLQVLLSQQHRLRALELLARFLDLGPWAVNQALSVGIFPYVLKLLQGQVAELRKTLVFIWAKILALDQSCQIDLVKDNGEKYFLSILANPKLPIQQLQQSAFILSVICNNYRPGQTACLEGNLLQHCSNHLSNPDPLLRRFVVFAMAKLWENHEEGKKKAIEDKTHEKLCALLSDPVPEVRAAAIYALGTFIGRSGVSSDDAEQRAIIEYRLGLTFAVVITDSSPLVRKELVIALASLVNAYEEKFKLIEKNNRKLEEQAEANKKKKPKTLFPSDTNEMQLKSGELSETTNEEQSEMEENGIHEFLWKFINSLSGDPFSSVSQLANSLIFRVKNQVTPAPKSQGSVSMEDLRNMRSPKSKQRLPFFIKPPAPPTPQSSLSASLPSIQNEELRSTLYDWSSQYFNQPILNPVNGNWDETSPIYNERRWRNQKNKELIEEARKMKNDSSVGVCSLENEIAILENESQFVTQLKFHPFETVVVVADENEIGVWNWEGGQKINAFSNMNAPGTRISAMHLLNAHDNFMIAVGSDDGVVRIWGGVYKPEPTLVTAWKALSVEGGQPGLVFDWQERNESMIASGNIDVLKIWDINRELFIQDISTQSTSSVSCITSNKADGERLIVAGFGDGGVRVFDKRVGNKFGMVAHFADHKKFVLNVFMPHSLDKQIISGSTSGEIKIWDVRTLRAVRSFASDIKKGEQIMTALAVHEYAPIIAIGQDQRIKVMNLSGEHLSLIRYHEGFLGQRIGPVSALSYHPYKVMLGAGATDSIVSIYTTKLKE
uniref:Raptor N-terminal CASPase-like domain-containing protein n=1 Tax=Arcella intermedia TaxID=1963864 RepID=A0A6B2KWT6_9EUKA